MNRKQLAILLVLVIVLGGAGLVLYQKENSTWKPTHSLMGKKLLGNFPFNAVTHIAISHGTNAVNLVKQDDLWRVRERHDYPANFTKISSFLIKARDLKIVQNEQVGPSLLSRFNLAPAGHGTNSATKVAFYGDKDKPITTLWLGKHHMSQPRQSSQFGSQGGYPDGRYVKVGKSDDVALISAPLDSIQTQPGQWLDKNFFKVQKPKTIEVTFPNATNSWELTRATETGKWTLADAKPGEKLDSSKISGMTSPFSSPSFSDVLPGNTPSQLGTAHPTVVKISTFNHFHYTIHIGTKTNDEYPVTLAVAAQIPQTRKVGKKEKPAEKAKLDKAFKAKQKKLETKLKKEQGYQKWTYLVSSWEVDPLLKHRSQLLAVKKPKTKKNEKLSQATGTGSGVTSTAPAALPNLANAPAATAKDGASKSSSTVMK